MWIRHCVSIHGFCWLIMRWVRKVYVFELASGVLRVGNSLCQCCVCIFKRALNVYVVGL